MRPLHVLATVPGPVSIPHHPIALDALLMAAAAMRDGLPPVDWQDEPTEIAIPVECVRGIYQATTARYQVEAADRAWVNRRFPIEEAQAMADPKFKRVLLSTGPTKSYRLPLEVVYLKDSVIEWWCTGDLEGVRDLLALVMCLGKKRSVGKGEIAEWRVEECEPWGDGFPVLRAGEPMRPLPLDWPGMNADAERGYRVLRAPYFQRWREEECAVPASGEA